MLIFTAWSAATVSPAYTLSRTCTCMMASQVCIIG